MPLSCIEIIYVDAHILVVNKPTLLLSVPGRAEDNKDCLVTRLQDNGYPDALIVHRLDWETTGLMILARDADSHRELSRQFQDREVHKRYTALCWGDLAQDEGQIELPMRYDPPNKPRQIVDHELGKYALTLWKVLQHNTDHCRIELTPYTGRSHQLRVHMAAIGHPILGDGLYAHPQGITAASRLCLHSSELSVTHPYSKEHLAFICPAPF
ncbi:MAG: RluA family pseudouridine synthase [Pseudomonas sp.]|nr:RluA family pseudouridine synthase [Pseudomonas sp.]